VARGVVMGATGMHDACMNEVQTKAALKNARVQTAVQKQRAGESPHPAGAALFERTITLVSSSITAAPTIILISPAIVLSWLGVMCE
jgi:hypothetical protein